MSISYKTPASFSGFSCLGGDCEDTCCRNWEVKLDRQHYELVKNAMLSNEHDKAVFDNSIYLNGRSIVSDHDFSFVRMREDGFCSMLDSKGLCSIHAKFGISTLGDVCTMYPRVVSRCGDTFELSGALSCPEVVRRCIDAKNPLKLKRFKPAELPRSNNYPIQRELSQLDDDFYSQHFSMVRDAIMAMMANDEYDFETRLYLITNLANKVSDFYHRGCDKSAGGQLDVVLSAYAERGFISKLDMFIKDYDAGSPISLLVTHSVLSIKLQQASTENISLLYNDLIQFYCHSNENIPEMLTVKVNNIIKELDFNQQQYIEQSLTRYILNCLYREWFVTMPDPFTYMQMLLVRISILRTLIYLDVGRDSGLNTKELEKKIVYVMYNFARNIDQNLEFLKVVYNALSEQNMMNFDFSPAFIRI
ncbi:MAG: flagellin lysine-N-methylase [Gammaproteobacteria bacterium]|nr:flagellin lysine-N-methylase [Gammaproteobacteria bacterium]